LDKIAFSIYDASAGSGKTFTLVKEYLKIILTSPKEDAYKSILAITFTNKAVGEMKSRVLDTLSEFAKDKPNPKAIAVLDVLTVETNLTALQIQTKAKAIIRNIIHNYASFDISTIDKFTHKVIRTFAHDLNLPSTFEVSLETENLLQEAIDAIIAEAGNDEILTKLLVDFTLEKTDDDKSWDVTRDIKEISKLITNENNRNELENFKDKQIPEFVELKRAVQFNIKDLEKQVVEIGTEAFQLISDNNLDQKSFNRNVVYNFFEKIKTGEIFLNDKIISYLEEGNRYAKSVPIAQQQAVDAVASQLLNFYTTLEKLVKEYLMFNAFLKNITPLSLLNRVSQELHKIQEEQNVLSISEFNTIIHNEIQNQPAPFIYERMGERYKHFFIDEFQDTSQMQWENLFPLINNALSGEDLSGEQGSLLIVGDPKQSIYRWRGGKAEQFIELSKKESPFSNPTKKVEPLSINWRSYSEVIDFNNAFFKFLSQDFENSDYKNLYENHSHQEKNDKIGGYINLAFIPSKEKNDAEYDRDELYLNAVLATLDKVQSEGFAFRDIVILTRKKDAGVKIASFLTEKRIPIVSSETLLLQNAKEVSFIITLLRYLKNGNDKESKAYALYYIANQLGEKVELHDFIAKGMDFKEEVAFEEWLASYQIELSFSQLRKKGLYEVVEEIIHVAIKPEISNAYVQDFLDRVLERSAKNQSGIADFLTYWDENSDKFSIPSPEGNEAVRIMTVHKSKGLEFPVVIFPFAEEDYSRTPKDKLWIDAESELISLPKILVDNNKTVENLSESAAIVFQQKKEEELLDNINILYVALTRAEEQLYIISEMKLSVKDEPSQNSMSGFFIRFLMSQGLFDKQQFVYERGDFKRISSPSKKTMQLTPITLVQNLINPKSIKIAQRESLMWGTLQQKAIEYGNVIHEILAYIKTKNDIDLAIEKALEKGLIVFEQQKEVKLILDQVCMHPDLKMYFDESNKVLVEQTILRKSDGLIKPDRIVFNSQNQVLLLDYKTGEKHQKHQKQIEMYGSAIENMGYQVVKKALVYIDETLEIVTL
jgi:ATP-dependent exoDNAse (exonuclease V) beta subunit